jgi:hypothetical protein
MEIWRPKPLNIWRCPNYANCVDEELSVCKEHEPGLTRTKFGKALPPQDDIEIRDDTYQDELDAGLKVGERCPPHIKDRAVGLLKK